MMDIFNGISWPQFIQLNEVRNLPLNEQVNKYNRYINELNVSRLNWLAYQNKGSLPTPPQDTNFLLQEDGFNILQEDGSKITIT
jgi:hypothetical protein